MDIITSKPFYIMRHAETSDNEFNIISGAHNPSLTKKGEAQALAAREIYKLLEPPPSQIIVTSLKRTHETAELVTGSKDYTTVSGLNERNLGAQDGITVEMEYKYNKDMGEDSMGVESRIQHGNRVVASLDWCLKNSNTMPFIVAHGGSIKRIMEAAGVNNPTVSKNAQIYQFVPVNGRWKIYELSAEQGKLQKKELGRATGMSLM